MTLKEYAKEIKKLAKEFPEANVVYSIDDEGNGFKQVYFTPIAGKFDGDGFRKCKKSEVTTVCIN